MISIRSVAAHEWREYRQIRLRALRDSPDAFGSTYDAEVARPDEAWASRVEAAISSGRDRLLFAFDSDELCGLVWGKLAASEPGRADVFQMWVAPASRGKGAGRALLAETLAWASGVGVHRIRLGVTTGDSPATRLYAASGFRPAGEPEPLRTGSALLAQNLELLL